MKGVGRRSLLLVILHDGSELVAAAKSAGLSPEIQVESYDTKILAERASACFRVET
jgi:hypothetical protein